MVPLAGESLGFLLLLQLIQNLQEEGTKQAGHLLRLGLVDQHDLPEPEQEEREARKSLREELKSVLCRKISNKRSKRREME